MVAFLLAVLPGSASAAVAAHQRVHATSASNSSNNGVTATCPAGSSVVGAMGSKSFAAGGQVPLVAIRPGSGLEGVAVSGVEDETGFAGNWAVTAYAICANPPSGLQRVAATSAPNTSNKGATATCPPGKKVLGAGGEIVGGKGQVSMSAIRPASGLERVAVTGVEDGTGFAGNWSVTAYAICAAPPAGLERVAVPSGSSSQSKDVIAACPPGKGLLGGGGEITGGRGQVVMELFPSVPDPRPASLTARGLEDEDGFADNWTHTAFAICAAVSNLFFATSPTDSFDKFATMDCPAATAVTGAGGQLDNGRGQVSMEALSPSLTGEFGPPTRVLVRGLEDETGFERNWFVRAYAICATPLPGLELVFDTGSPDPAKAPFANATATCPPGTQVVGAGAEINGGSGEVMLQRLVPSPNPPTSVEVTAHEDLTGFAGNWTVNAYALCATPPPGLQLVARTGPADSSDKSVTAACPAGKNVLGAGGNTGGLGELMLTELRPDAFLKRVTATSLEDEDGYENLWSLTAYAICANA